MSRTGTRRNPALMRRPSGVVLGGALTLPDAGWDMDLDADPATITLASGRVSAWAGQSATAINAVQTDPSRRPLYQSSVASLNGKPAVECDGSARIMETSTHPTSSSDHTFFAAYDQHASPGNDECLISWLSGGTIFRAANAYLGDVGWFDAAAVRIAAVSTGAQVVCWTLDSSGGTGEVFRDGSSLGTGTYTSRALAASGRIFAHVGSATSGNPVGLKLARILHAPSVLTADEIAATFAYLQQEYIP